MKRALATILMAGSLSLGACASSYEDRETLQGAGTGAAIGAAAGAGLGAVVGGISPVEGALVGAAVGGIAGAVWADQNNDGVVDGYYRDGTYYPGQPPAAAAPAYQTPPPAYQPAPPVMRSGERG